jgi:hypothetical protein
MIHNQNRRSFLRLGAMAGAAQWLAHGARAQSPQTPRFPDSDPKWARTWDAALAVLAGNIKLVPRYDQPVLLEGAVYPGIWQECGPLEGLVYASLSQFVARLEGHPTPQQVARANHMAFFALQHEDGQLPASVKMTEAGYGQIQMVVPIAATAWELAQQTHDDELLRTAYASCSRWDAWLRRYRDTRGTGLVEGFCTYDTGMDNSMRWKGIPNRCPDADARKFPPIASMPRICPDLSATVYGGRVALAAMARALGKNAEAAKWDEGAETIRELILEKLYSPEDAAFYDLDAQNQFVRVRSVVIHRVLGEHVLKLEHARDRGIFHDVWTRQIHNPSAFWAPFPFPSVAMDDPQFVRPIPRNSWGGATQALTALRTPRWMPHYGKQREFRHLMQQWVEAISGYTEFRQQMDPLTGDFTRIDASGYSPAALVYLDFIRRLSSKAAATA